MINRRFCGNSELEQSELGLGCWAFGGGDYWGDQDQKDVDQVVRRAVELGITYFDTAESYNEGGSEVSLGKVIRATPGVVNNRQQMLKLLQVCCLLRWCANWTMRHGR